MTPAEYQRIVEWLCETLPATVVSEERSEWEDV